MDANKFNKLPTLVAALAVVTGLATLPAHAADSGSTAAEARVSSVSQTARGGRDGVRSAPARLTYAPLVTGGQRSSGLASSSKTNAATAKQRSNDFWFYDADVVLFNDDDRDGYYHGIDLLFDVDTVFDEVDVYAVVFLSREGGPWNEYAVSNTFVINGATSDDEYVIVTELESGYPTGSYDLLIELYDAIDGTFLTSYGPEDSSELAYLPLEDYQKDAPYIDEVIVVGHGGGNAFGLLLLGLLVPLMRRLASGAGARSA